MSSEGPKLVDAYVQTDNDDFSDALRINPMVVSFVTREQQNKTVSKTKEKDTKRHDIDDLHTVELLAPQKIVRETRPATEEECYSTEYQARGICLVLEHDEFKPSMHLSSRKGSDVDLRAVNGCFAKMGFEVYIKRNLRYSEVQRTLDEVASMNHSKYDCFALVLLTHGNEGSVFAYDAAYPTQRLWEAFTPTRAPTLTGKPKLFFLQACQGNLMDKGVRIMKDTATDSFASYKVPVHADFLIAHSTVAGYYSWRNTAAGSWFMQSLVAVMENERHRRDVLTMLTMTNCLVTREYESSSSHPDFNDKKQTPFFYSTLTYKFYLEPKKLVNT